MAVFGPCTPYTRTRPCTRSVHVYTASVHGFVHGRVHVYTARTRPCTRVHGRRVHGVHGRVHDGVHAVYTCCTLHVHGRVRVYTAYTRPCTRTVYMYKTVYTAV